MRFRKFLKPYKTRGSSFREHTIQIRRWLQLETVDVQKEVLEEVELLGRTGYFTELRVDKETVPEEMHCYELRYGDDDGFPVSVEESVRVNYFGAVLFTETLELGNEKALQFGYEDFSYTGGQMYLSQVIGGQEPEDFKDGKELAEFVAGEISITEEEGQKLIGYMEGHDYCLGHMDGKMFRGDLCWEQGKVHWEPYDIEDAVNIAAEWNYELLQEAEEAVLDPEDDDYADKKNYLDTLRKDEEILDKMFDRTRYGKELDALAVTLAEALIADISREGGIDAAVRKMTDQIKAGEDLLPDVSPALKKDGGRSR